MNDCLIKNIDAVVNNDSFNKFGEVKINIAAESTFDYMFRGAFRVTLLDSSKKLIVGGSSVQYVDITNDGPVTITFPVGTYTITITNSKYGITHLIHQGSVATRPNSPMIFPIDAIAYSRDLKYITNVRFSGDIGKVGVEYQSLVSWSSYGLEGSVDDFVRVMNGIPIEGCYIYASNIEGDISKFGYLNNINSLVFMSTYLKGDIENLANVFRTERPSLSSIQLTIPDASYVTFGQYGSFGFGTARIPVLKWTSDTVVYQGGPDSDVENPSLNIKIYAKGASASQISTWESQGNTVYIVG